MPHRRKRTCQLAAARLIPENVGPRLAGLHEHVCVARDEFPPPHGAYPKAKDYGLSIAGLEEDSGLGITAKVALAS